MAQLAHETLDEPLRSQISEAVRSYASPRDFFVQRVAEGVSILAAAFAPEPVIVRMSDFKSNEYANLVGGELYEPPEENPRSEEHTSELQSLMHSSSAVFCLKKKHT